MWIDLHQLEKVHGSPNTQQRPKHHYESPSSRINVSVVAVHSQIAPTAQNHVVNSWTRGTCRTEQRREENNRKEDNGQSRE